MKDVSISIKNLVFGILHLHQVGELMQESEQRALPTTGSLTGIFEALEFFETLRLQRDALIVTGMFLRHPCLDSQWCSFKVAKPLAICYLSQMR